MKPKEILIIIDKLKNNSLSNSEKKYIKENFQDIYDSKDLLSVLQEEYEKSIKQQGDIGFKNQLIIRNRLYKATKPKKTTLSYYKRTYYYAIAIAAMLLVISTVFYYNKRYSTPEIDFQTVTTKPGERKKVTLIDGSTILLNGSSSISYPNNYEENIRLVKLSGEAFFDISPNKQKPFLVVADNFTTQVVGTSFSITTDNNIGVEVNTGKVNVFKVQSDTILKSYADNKVDNNFTEELGKISSDKISLVKGEMAHYDQLGNWNIQSYNLNKWSENVYTYLDTPIQKVIRDLHRNFGDSITLDPTLNNERITITFRNRNKTQIIKTLAELCNGKIELNQQKSIWHITKN